MIILFFILGAVFASFYTVVSLRLPREGSIVKPSSHCEYCNHKLAFYDLIPIISYVLLFGKCRYCKKHLSIYYPLLELIQGLLFSLGYYLYGFSYELYAYLVIVSLLTIIFVSDFKYLVILDFPLFLGIILILVLKYVYFGFIPTLYALASGIILFIFLLLTKFVGDKVYKRESLGWGDVKFALFMGCTLGLKLGLAALIIGSVLALPFALFYIAKKQEKEIPYGPFLILAVYLVFVFMSPISYLINMLLLINQ